MQKASQSYKKLPGMHSHINIINCNWMVESVVAGREVPGEWICNCSSAQETSSSPFHHQPYLAPAPGNHLVVVGSPASDLGTRTWWWWSGVEKHLLGISRNHRCHHLLHLNWLTEHCVSHLVSAPVTDGLKPKTDSGCIYPAESWNSMGTEQLAV
jgi:hypothetical protein